MRPRAEFTPQSLRDSSPANRDGRPGTRPTGPFLRACASSNLGSNAAGHLPEVGFLNPCAESWATWE
jgi:hypothetical protein